MASSSDNEDHRSQPRPKPLVRQTSSFIGTIKNIVKAPLNWFALQDEHAATPGKRRRPLEQQPTEEIDEEADSEVLQPPSSAIQADSDDEGPRSSKRMRLHSPPRQHYLDPPTASLRRTAPPRRSSVIPRSASAMLPSSAGSRSTLSPRRQYSTSRTMSIDPPSRAPNTQDSSAFNFGPPPSSAESDYEMAVDSQGDWSVPPSPRRSPRPSFRMRSSATPQPQFSRAPLRYISEPPLLNSLVSNPAFVQAPNQTLAPLAETSTLGSLVETVKAAKSPTKPAPNSSLFSSDSFSDAPTQKDGPSERVLHQLDVYKTPLLPSRLRASDVSEALTGNRTPDMFSSRRRKRLELMTEERKKANGEVKVPVTNETKPYAGGGALRKLLARRKQETVDEEQPKVETETPGSEVPAPSNPVAPSPIINDVPPPPPMAIPTGPDLFAPSTNSSLEGGSSLRVGRAISSRKHFSRPSPLQRPTTSKFSAVYEDDGDDAMGDEPKVDTVPQLFSEPPGFSFAKETAGPDLSAELAGAKEPPLTSLPFGFAKPAVPKKPTTVPTPSPAPASVAVPPVSDSKASSSSTTKSPQPNFFGMPKSSTPHSTSNGIPNFFANSALKQAPMPAAPVVSFPSSSSATSSAPINFFAVKPKPVDLTPKVDNDKENPFWVGGSDKPVEPAAKAPAVSSEKVFGGFGQNASAKPAAEAPASGGAPSSFSFSAPSQGFSFGKPTQADAPSSNTPVNPPNGKPAGDAPKPFTFGPSNVETKAATESSAVPATTNGGSSDSVAAPTSLFGEKKPESAIPNFFASVKPAPPSGNLFGAPTPAAPAPSSAFKFDSTPEPSRAATPTFAASTTAPSQPNFFATPAAQTSSSEPPKSMFNSSSAPAATGFSFGQPQTPSAEKTPGSTPFSFAPTTPSTEAPKSNMFSFGQAGASSAPAAAAPSTTAPFSFSSGPGAAASTTADVSNKSFFTFGQATPAAAPQRPVTPPPKNMDNEFMMEESPIQDLSQANKAPEARPTLGGGAFSFGNSNTSSGGSMLFGNTAGSSSSGAPFTFGTSAPSNPFEQKKPEAAPAFGGFGQSAAPAPPPIQTSFSFGQPTKSAEPQRPHTAGGFGGFGATPTSATGAAPAFTFGAAAAPSNPNPFGQPASSNSAPSSPSTFNQSNPFSFGGAAAPTGAFTFGSSQPASPAAGGNLSLPPSGFGNQGGFGQAQQPSSPFGAPAMLPSTSGGGAPALFTIGAAPPQTTQTGARVTKKLPTRRGGVKR